MNHIVYDKSKENIKALIRKVNTWPKINYYLVSHEQHTKDIENQILVEELLLDKKTGKIPYDYKFHCFGGEVVFIQVDIDRFERHVRNLYSPTWEIMDVVLHHKNDKTLEVHKPDQLDEMIQLSEKLSGTFSYVRVDLYNTAGCVFFGELTFTPGNGFEKFSPNNYDYYLGEKYKFQ